LAGRDEASARSYWRGRLDGLRSATALPLPAPREAAGAAEFGEQAVAIPDASAAALAALARRHDLPRSTLLHGAWALLLSRYGDDDDVVFGSVSAGRDWAGADADNLVGLFLRVFPIRTDVPAGERLIAWLKRL